MNRMMLALVLVFSVFLIPVSYAEAAKEGTTTLTWSYIVTPPLTADIGLDKAGSAGVYEVLGVLLSDQEEGPLHRMSTRGVALWTEAFFKKQGIVSKKTSRYGVWTDHDGDQIFLKAKFEKNFQNYMRFIGGTGKFAGMELTVLQIDPAEPIEVSKLRSLKEGHTFGVRKIKVQWNLL